MAKRKRSQRARQRARKTKGSGAATAQVNLKSADNANGAQQTVSRTAVRSNRRARREAQRRATRLKQIRYAGLIVLAVAVVAALFAWRSTGEVPASELEALVGPNLDGPDTAPVRVVEYGDFGCPSCRAWHNAGIKGQLKETFGDQVSFEFRHFPVITAQSPKAAEASQCAAEQGAFWEFHDYVYEETPQGALGEASLKQYAAAIGLDQAGFDECLDSSRYRQFVIEQAREAQQAGARGTPTFIINGQQVSPFYEAMAGTIEQLLGS